MKLPFAFASALAFASLLSLPTLASPEQSLVRINSTAQTFNIQQPWEKTPPRSRRGLGCLLPNQQVLTTADIAANATYLEFQSSDGNHTIPARLLAIDYEANLALLAPEDDPGFLGNLTPAELSEPIGLNSTISIYQLEDNGMPLHTEGQVRSTELLSTFIDGSYYLSYMVRASMQSAASSYTLPAFHDGKLVGILNSYDSKDQISEVTAIEIIKAFLQDQSDGNYEGFPTLGVAYNGTEDTHFRSWLGLSEDQGGVYISRVQPTGTADGAGLKEGDVLLAINGQAIDRRGYYQHPQYGSLYWTHLIRGSNPVGTEVTLTILRDSEEQEVKATLNRPTPPLVPIHLHDQAPLYLIKGGLIFQELTLDLLQSYGQEWQNAAPLNLLDVLNNPQDYEEGRRRVVVVTRIIPTAATIGYERIHGRIVTSVNGQAIADLGELAALLEKETSDGVHRIEIDDNPFTLFLDEKLSDSVDQQFLQQGLPSLSRLKEKE